MKRKTLSLPLEFFHADGWVIDARQNRLPADEGLRDEETGLLLGWSSDSGAVQRSYVGQSFAKPGEPIPVRPFQVKKRWWVWTPRELRKLPPDRSGHLPHKMKRQPDGTMTGTLLSEVIPAVKYAQKYGELPQAAAKLREQMTSEARHARPEGWHHGLLVTSRAISLEPCVIVGPAVIAIREKESQ